MEKEQNNINNGLFSHYFKYSSPSDMYSRLSDAEGEMNETQIDLIKKALTKMKKPVENIPKVDSFKIEEKKR